MNSTVRFMKKYLFQIQVSLMSKTLMRSSWVLQKPLTKSSLLRKNIYFKGLVQGVRGDRLRLRREAFKSSARNKLARSVTQVHNFFTNRVTPRWNKRPETVISAPSLITFKSALDGHHKRFGYYGH